LNRKNLYPLFDLEDCRYYVGSSNQKIRQHIACGKPVIATPRGNAFSEEAGLGTIVQNHHIQGFVAALKKWLDRYQEEKEEHERNAFKFAQRYFSVEKALADRIAFWSQRL
jgi:glycosyltransferase involved in cell wall biosynthesis